MVAATPESRTRAELRSEPDRPYSRRNRRQPRRRGDLSRRVPEGFALDEYKSERISKAQLRRLPGFETRYELDDFQKAHQVGANVSIEDVRRDVRELKSRGL